MLGRKQWQGGYCSRCLFSSVSALAVSVGTVFHGSLLCEILARGSRGRSALVWWQRWQLIAPRIKQEIFDLSVMVKHLFPTASSRDVHCSTDVLWFSSWRYQEGWGMCSTKAPLTLLVGVTLEVVHLTSVQLTCLFFVTCFRTLSKPFKHFLPPGKVENRFQVPATATIDFK